MKLSFSAEDIQKMQENLNNGWLNVVVKERREPSPTGITHYLEVDNWKPTPREEGGDAPQKTPEQKAAATPAAGSAANELTPEDLPF